MAKKALGEENTGAKHKNHRNKSVENAQKRYADISSEMKQFDSDYQKLLKKLKNAFGSVFLNEFT